MNDFALTNPENPDLCDFSKSQWYTPPELAERIVRWALWPLNGTRDQIRALEPSCGRGSLVRALIAADCEVTGIDLAPQNIEHCREEYPGAYICANFLKITGFDVRHHLAVLNPPFEEGQTEAHVLHALKFAPIVVCHCPLTTLAGKDRREGLWSKAYLKRLVIHSSRPKYSGSRTGGMTDMCTIYVVRRFEEPRSVVAATGLDVEWW